MATVIRRKRGEERPKKVEVIMASIGPSFRAAIKNFRQPTASESIRAANALFIPRQKHATASC